MTRLSRAPARHTAIVLIAAIGMSVVGCGGAAVGSTTSTAVGAAPAPPVTGTGTSAPVSAGRPASGCAPAVASILGGVAKRIYAQAAAGRNVVAARQRLARSPALAAAVLHGNGAATVAALRPLLKQQIHRIVVSRGSHVLARIGRTPALAPVAGVISDPAGHPVGRYVMSVAEDAAITGITHSTTGAQVVMRSGATTVATTLHPAPASLPASGTVHLAGTDATVVSYAARAFPSGSLRVSMLIPATDLTTCGATPAETQAATYGAIAQRLYRTESSGSAVARVLHHVATDRGFELAVARNDPAALRTSIVRFFRQRTLHVVRIRATTAAGRLIDDVGGPYVIAPASAAVHDRTGKLIGHVTLSVQDDTGYIKLLHRFTGGAVLLRATSGIVPGSTRVRPASVPDAGTLAYAGRAYQVYSFTAQAFPTGPLRVSLLLPQ